MKLRLVKEFLRSWHICRSYHTAEAQEKENEVYMHWCALTCAEEEQVVEENQALREEMEKVTLLRLLLVFVAAITQ